MSERPQYAIEDYVPLMERVRRCERENRGIRIVGGTTAGQSASGGEGAGIERVETRALSKVVDHATADMTITVQAGMTVSELQRVLRAANQHLPIDVAAPERTTVGGMISKALAGSRRFSRGTVRDLLIGVAVVGAGGSLIRGGGRVVKNVAGYDLCKMYAGSWGWLGVVVEGTFKVAAIPESSAAVCAEFSDMKPISMAADALMASRLLPASMDLFVGATAWRRVTPGAAGETVFPFRIVVGFEGLREAVDAQARRCRELLASIGGATTIFEAADYSAVRQAASDVLVCHCAMRIGVKPSDVAALAARLATEARATAVAAHLGNGVVNATFHGEGVDWNAIVAMVHGFDGHWVIPSFQESPSDEVAMIGPLREDWAVMRRVKEELDPAGVFSRDTGYDRALRGG